MASRNSGERSEGVDKDGSVRGGSKNSDSSLQSSIDEVKENLERLVRSVGELNSKLKSTEDVLKWVLEALSRRSDEKEAMYLRSIEASNELLSSFMAFVNSRVKPLADKGTTGGKEKGLTKEVVPKGSPIVSTKKEDEYLVKPSMVKRLQEEEGKEKEKKSR